MIELTKDDGSNIDRTKLEDLLKQKFFYDMSFSIYGGKCSQFLVFFVLSFCGRRGWDRGSVSSRLVQCV